MEQQEIEQEIIAEKKSISNLYRFLLVFLFTVAAAFAVFYYSSKRSTSNITVNASVLEVRLQNLENTMTAHEKRVTQLEERKSNAPAANAQEAKVPEAVVQRMESMEKEIKSLNSVNNVSRQDVYQAVKIISSFNRLSRVVTLGKPFSAELSAFLDVYGTENDKAFDEVITALTPYSDSGVPTQAALTDTFENAVETVEGLQATPPENAGFWATLWFNISHMVSIRRVDRTMEGNSSDAIIARAYDYVSSGETEAAVAEIKALPDNIKNHFSDWLEEAQAVSTAPALMDELEEKVMKKAFADNDNSATSAEPEK